MSGDLTAVGGLVDRNAFRIVQESVTNVMKHAPDHTARVVIDIGDDVVDVSVRDRATGSSQTGSRPPGLGATGNGIIGMRERATAVGGSFAAGPAPDGGWDVQARLPLGDLARREPTESAEPQSERTPE